MIYSGNLNDYHLAHDRVKSLGFCIEHQRWCSIYTRNYAFGYTIWISSTECIRSPNFEHYDENVMTIQATEWLTKMYRDLSSWK